MCSYLLSCPQLAPLLTQIIHALAYLHQNGIVHRDLKPSNVLVNADMRCLVTDFGIASFTSLASTENSEQLLLQPGTAEFMPPEAFVANSSASASTSTSQTAVDTQLSPQSQDPESETDIEEQRRNALLQRLRKNKKKVKSPDDDTQTNMDAPLLGMPQDSINDFHQRAKPRRSDSMTSAAEASLFKWDIYSYAIVVCSVLSGKLPYKDVKDTTKLPQLVVDGLRPPLPSQASPSLTKLIRQMWHKDPVQRPHSHKVQNFFMDEVLSSVIAV